jgi:ribosome-binding protein aMBF1 (putative translation factor)
MEEIRDTALEEAMATLSTDKKKKEVAQRKTNARVKRHKEQTKIMFEAMQLITTLRRMGWAHFKIAKKAHVSEQTIKKWESGHSCPQTNNLIALRNLTQEECDGA